MSFIGGGTLHTQRKVWLVGCMLPNAILNNISAISWWSVLLVEETRVPGENHRPVTSRRHTLYKKMLNQVHIAWAGFELTTLVVIGTDCIGRYKSIIRSRARRPIVNTRCNGFVKVAIKWETNIPHCRKGSKFQSKNVERGKNNQIKTNKQQTQTVILYF